MQEYDNFIEQVGMYTVYRQMYDLTSKIYQIEINDDVNLHNQLTKATNDIMANINTTRTSINDNVDEAEAKVYNEAVSQSGLIRGDINTFKNDNKQSLNSIKEELDTIDSNVKTIKNDVVEIKKDVKTSNSTLSSLSTSIGSILSFMSR